MQKFVTIYLDNATYGAPKAPGCYSDNHGLVEEHLAEYLSDGWRVVTFFGVGGAASPACQGWFGVLLERDDSP